jgi:cytochrome c oxidase subunit 2
MVLRKLGIGAAVAALLATPAFAEIKNFQIGFQQPQSEIMDRISAFHTELFWIMLAVCVFVALLLIYIMVKFRAGANPVPSKVHHNTLLEVAWTIIPVIILVIIAVPSFKLLYAEAIIPPNVDVHIKAIGKQWFWTYEYPGANAGFSFDSLGLTDADAAKAGKPRLLGTDNPIYVPVGKIVEVETTGADVIHSFAMPQMGVKMDAVPGRLNHTWFKADNIGVFYGQCSELCGARHAYMPIELHVVSAADYAAWLAASKKKFAALDVPAPRLASK